MNVPLLSTILKKKAQERLKKEYRFALSFLHLAITQNAAPILT